MVGYPTSDFSNYFSKDVDHNKLTRMEPKKQQPKTPKNSGAKATQAKSNNRNNNNNSPLSFQPFDNIKNHPSQKRFSTPSPKPKSPSNQMRYSPKPMVQNNFSSPRPIPTNKRHHQQTPGRSTPPRRDRSVSYTQLTLPTNREV